MSTTPPAPALLLLAAALDAPGLQLDPGQPAASRWRGPLGAAHSLALQTGRPHRHQRLQLLRRVLDLQADGRWALRAGAGDGAGWIGPLRGLPPDPAAPGPDLATCLASWPHATLLRRLFLWLDGRRVDAQLARRFPGAAADLALDPAPALPAWLRASAPPQPALDAGEALHQALQWLQQLLRHRRQPCATAAAVSRSSAGLRLSAPAAQPGGDSTDAPQPTGPGDASQAVAAGHGTGRPMPAPTAPTHTSGQAGPSDGNSPQAAAADPAPQAPGSTAGPRRGGRTAAHSDAGHTTWHDEWDHRLQAHRRRWTAVHEHRVQGSDLQFLAGLQQRFPALSRQIRRRFAHLQGDAPRRERRLRDGDSVDLDAALDSLAARRAGQPGGDDRLYQAQPLQARSLSVALLLDTSGSTGFPIPDRRAAAATADGQDDVLWQAAGSRLAVDTRPRRRVIDVAKDAAALLCEALHTLGDRHAVFGFSGDGRLQVDFAVLKDFSDPWSAQSAAALAAVQPQGATRTGAAVRHALRRLQAEPARRRLLIVLSDGYPQDSDYGSKDGGRNKGDGHDALQYGLQDTAQALREAERAGVRCFNISVDAAANDYLRRICPRQRYCVVDDVDSLPARLLALVRLLA